MNHKRTAKIPRHSVGKCKLMFNEIPPISRKRELKEKDFLSIEEYFELKEVDESDTLTLTISGGMVKVYADGVLVAKTKEKKTGF